MKNQDDLKLNFLYFSVRPGLVLLHLFAKSVFPHSPNLTPQQFIRTALLGGSCILVSIALAQGPSQKLCSASQNFSGTCISPVLYSPFMPLDSPVSHYIIFLLLAVFYKVQRIVPFLVPLVLIALVASSLFLTLGTSLCFSYCFSLVIPTVLLSPIIKYTSVNF